MGIHSSWTNAEGCVVKHLCVKCLLYLQDFKMEKDGFDSAPTFQPLYCYFYCVVLNFPDG